MRKFDELTEKDIEEVIPKMKECLLSDKTLSHSAEVLDLDYDCMVKIIENYEVIDDHKRNYIVRRTLTRLSNCIKKYGVKSNLLLPEVREKSNKNIWSESARKKREETNMRKFGGKYPLSSGTTTRKKYEDTMVERYGAHSAFCGNTTLREEMERKCKEEHGCSVAKWGNIVGTKTTREHYGVDYYFQTDEANKKILRNLNERGFGGPQSVHLGENTCKIISSKETLEEYILSIDEKERFRDLMAENLGISVQQFNHYLRLYDLRHLLRKQGGSSKSELEIGDIISGWGIEVVRRTRKVIPPYEIDIFIPEMNIGIEYDGTFWHKDRKERDDLKDSLCMEKGIKLIRIKEDDYIESKDSIIYMLFEELGLSEKYSIVMDVQECEHELREFYDIEVDDDSHNFTTDSGVVHNSVDLRQLLESQGFTTAYTSLDRKPDGYDSLKSAINDKRLVLLKGNKLVYEELANLEKDNMTHKYDHPAYSCFTGDTKIRLVDGRTLTIEELLYEQEYKDNWVYTMNESTHKIEPKRIKKVYQTKLTKDLVKVTFDNGESVVCTPDHRFMLRDGSYEEIRNLSAGTSLMPLYTKVPDNSSLQGYRLYYEPFEDKWHYEHRYFCTNGDGRVVHHRNYNKLDNRPSNLIRVSQKDYSKISVYIKIPECFVRGRCKLGKNHKIVSIEKVQMPCRVYDLTIEDNPNFALDAGVFVHNSKDLADSLAGAFWDALQFKEEYLYFNHNEIDYESLNTSVDERQEMLDSMMSGMLSTGKKVVVNQVSFEPILGGSDFEDELAKKLEANSTFLGFDDFGGKDGILFI